MITDCEYYNIICGYLAICCFKILAIKIKILLFFDRLPIVKCNVRMERYFLCSDIFEKNEALPRNLPFLVCGLLEKAAVYVPQGTLRSVFAHRLALRLLWKQRRKKSLKTIATINCCLALRKNDNRRAGACSRRHVRIISLENQPENAGSLQHFNL